MHIVIVIDSNRAFLKQCMVMLYGLCTHHTNPWILHIIHTPEAKDIFTTKWELLSHFVGTTQVTLQYYEVNFQRIQDLWLHTYNDLPLTTYFRLLIPALLDPSINRCIYMDGDMLVRGSIDTLWNLPMSDDQWIAGVMTNVLTSYMANIHATQYINAGMIVINLNAWRTHYLGNQIIEFIAQHPQWLEWSQNIMGDQCWINALCQWHILPVDPLWNATPLWRNPDYIDNNEIRKIVWYSDIQIRQAQQQPTIIHFAWSKKPASWMSFHPWKLEYYRMLFATGLIDWTDFIKAMIHIITYPLRIDRPIYQGLQQIRRFIYHQSSQSKKEVLKSTYYQT